MKTLYFDPLEINGSPHNAGIIFISHEHYDHFSPKDIEKVAGAGTEIVFPKSMESKISETVGREKRPAYHEFGRGGTGDLSGSVREKAGTEETTVDVYEIKIVW